MVRNNVKAILLLLILMPLAGCWFETSADKDNPYEKLVAKEFVTSTTLYKDAKTNLLWQKKHSGKTQWYTLQKGTRLKVKSITTRLLETGRHYYAICSYEKNGENQEADMPLNQPSIKLEAIWSELPNK